MITIILSSVFRGNRLEFVKMFLICLVMDFFLVVGCVSCGGNVVASPTNCDDREEIVRRYELVFGSALTDEQQAVKEFIFLGSDNMDEVLKMDLPKQLFEVELKHID